MIPLISMPAGGEWFIILAIVILVFGASKLPDLARGSGQALRIFKAETKGLREDEKKDEAEIASDTPAPTPTRELTESDVAEAEIVDERRENNPNNL
ncbi:twin-arginine translocase TatA/TatE family subunit [Nocardioides sp.]|uniref:twin-arginine translocase TatA/TatE family subunit n=1 Tax=Nocardioides sp. TaxID=35761 RepID=UPI0035120279